MNYRILPNGDTIARSDVLSVTRKSGGWLKSIGRVAAAAALLLAGTLMPIGAAAPDQTGCINRKVAFDGIQPLRYASVVGSPDSKAYLHAQYPSRCASADVSSCQAAASLNAGEAVAIGKTCGRWAYVQHIGPEHMSVGWVASSRLQDPDALLPFDDGAPGGHVRQGSWPPPWTIGVKLTKGEGIPVCEAYLQRLSQTVFHEPAFCGVPENAQIPGFLYLQRRPLQATLVNKLFVPAWNIFHVSTDQMMPPPANERDLIGRAPVGTKFEQLTDKDAISVWGYEPKVDIENNGKPDNVLIWRDFPPLWPVIDSASVCGNGSSGVSVDAITVPIIPLILNAANDSIDVGKTVAVFGDHDLPKPRPSIFPQYAIHPAQLIPLGITTDAFVYKGKSYFSVFRESRTVQVIAGTLSPVEAGHLSVYFHHAGVTQEICRYQSESAAHWGSM